MHTTTCVGTVLLIDPYSNLHQSCAYFRSRGGGGKEGYGIIYLETLSEVTPLPHTQQHPSPPSPHLNQSPPTTNKNNGRDDGE